MDKANRGLILSRVLIVLAIVVVCLSVGLSVYFLVGKSEKFSMELSSSEYVNVGETFNVEVTRTDPSDESYELVVDDQSVLKFVSKAPSNTDSNKITYTFTALGGGRTEVKLSTPNTAFNGKSFTIFVGDGTKDSPYYVRNVTDLTEVTDNDKQDKFFRQVSDIDLKDIAWEPKAFGGVYDGAGNYIKNLKLTNKDNAGLFSTLNVATVANLKLLGFNITEATTAGAVAAQNNGGKITLVSVTGSTIRATTAGGIVGTSTGSGDEPTSTSNKKTWSTIISGCSVENSTIRGTTAGGIAGEISNTYIGNSYSNLSGGNSGIVGKVNETSAVVNTYAIGNVTGGLIGSSTGENSIGGNYVGGSLEGDANAQKLTTFGKIDFMTVNNTSWDFDNIWDIQDGSWPTIRSNANIANDGEVVPTPTNPQSLVIYNVVFESNGGENVGSVQITEGNSFVTEGKSFPMPTKKKYLFAGWYTDSALTNEFTASSTVKSNLVVFAKWEENFYTVSFVSNCDTTFDSVKITKNSSFALDIESLPHPQKENASFIGWFVDEEQSAVFGLNTPVKSDITIYAGWQEEAVGKFVVSFDARGGSEVAAMEITQGKSFSEDGYVWPTPTRENYSFVGWYTDKELTNAFTITTIVESNLTVYAKWEQVTIHTDVDKLKRSFAADLADDGKYNNTYNISSNINFAGTTWTPIGSISQPFEGEFNFTGEISDLKIVATNSRYVGFFGVIGNNGVVNGLNLRNVSIELNNVANPVVGFVAGSNLGHINNCAVTNSNYASERVNATGSAVVGGLVGENYNTIENSIVDTQIAVVANQAQVGGVVGANVNGQIKYVEYFASEPDNTKILVNTTGDKVSSAGGVVGELSDGAVQYSSSNAQIALVNADKSEAYVGGIVGVITDTVTAKPVATVFACSADSITLVGKVAGGLVGKVAPSNEQMFDCVLDSVASGQVYGLDKAGGLVGEMVRGNMKHCVTTCELSGKTVAGIAVDILRDNDSDIASVDSCVVFVSLGDCDTAYYSTASRVFETDAGFWKALEWVGAKYSKVAGYETNCMIVDNIDARRQLEFAFGGNAAQIDLNHLFSENKNEKLVSESKVKTAATYTDLGFDENIWNIADGEIPTIKK